MPTISKMELLERVLSGLEVSGWDARLQDRSHPFDILASSGLVSHEIRVYIWNVTHGGGQVRSPGEYRIQITGVETPITAPADVQILLLGWHEDLGVFAAFDPTLHRRPSELSPSLQIPLTTLVTGQSRMARHIRGNGETALAFPPKRMGRYVLHQRYLHLSLDEPEDALDELDDGLAASDSAEILEARDAIARAAGAAELEEARSGQRYVVDAETKRAIELYAMQRAIAHLEEKGWEVEDVSSFAPYDLSALRGSRVLHVEVKGTTSSGRSVLLTPNEVHHARTTLAEVALFIVAYIDVEGRGPEAYATGGDAMLIDPWNIIESNLHPVGYEYVLPEAT
jgi:hypothetical protein